MFHPAKISSPWIHCSPTQREECFAVTWDSIADLRYQLQYKDALNEATWTDVSSPVTARDVTTSTDDTSPAGRTQLFYRVLVVP